MLKEESKSDKEYKGWLCECFHIRGVHRLLTSYGALDEDCDDYDHNTMQVRCYCGCTRYKKISNLQYLEAKYDEQIKEK